jgi:hypothetical protein
MLLSGISGSAPQPAPMRSWRHMLRKHWVFAAFAFILQKIQKYVAVVCFSRA